MAAPKITTNNVQSLITFEGTHNSIVNALRRTIIDHVPTFAIEDVEVVKNESPLYDETIAQRLGLIPLSTDLKSYNFKSECSCGGVGCALCEVKLSLFQDEEGYVNSGALQSDDPQIIPVDKDIPITKIFPGKKIELNLKAVLGTGIEHAKWAPAHSYLKEGEKEGEIVLIVEPHGQLDAKTIYNTSIDILTKKITELEEQL